MKALDLEYCCKILKLPHSHTHTHNYPQHLSSFKAISNVTAVVRPLLTSQAKAGTPSQGGPGMQRLAVPMRFSFRGIKANRIEGICQLDREAHFQYKFP